MRKVYANAAYMRGRRARAILAGLCSLCAIRAPDPPYRRCEGCRVLMAKYNRERRERLASGAVSGVNEVSCRTKEGPDADTSPIERAKE